MNRGLTNTLFLCALLVFGCASAGNGQTVDPVEEPESQVPEKPESSEPALDAKRVEAKADCEKCNGQWGKHGLAQVEGCICRTSDFSKPCGDGDDCEGVCIKKGDEFKCSEFVTVFGCYEYLPKGWSKRADKEKPPVPRICLD